MDIADLAAVFSDWTVNNDHDNNSSPNLVSTG